MGGKLLITGASGLVGANLIRTLLAQGRNVCALVHEDRRALVGLEVETITADVRDPEALERVMRGVDVVYHLAGSISLTMDSGTEMNATNALGTRNVVAACLRGGVRRMVHFSSIDALRQEPVNEPVDENRGLVDEGHSSDTLIHIPPYDLSKAQSEREVLSGTARGLDAVIVRPTAMLGPYDFKPSYLGRALIQLAHRRIPAMVNSGFDWVDVRDVVTGAIQAEQTASSGECFMLSGSWHSIREVAKLVADYSHQAALLFTVPLWVADAFAPVMLKLARFNGTEPIYTRVTLHALRGSRQVSSARATRELGYTSRPLAETVRDTLSWFQKQGYLTGNNP